VNLKKKYSTTKRSVAHFCLVVSDISIATSYSLLTLTIYFVFNSINCSYYSVWQQV